MVRGRKVSVVEVKCPNPDCGKTIKTEKETDIQCRHCGERFDLD